MKISKIFVFFLFSFVFSDITAEIPGSEIYLFDIDNHTQVPTLSTGKNITQSVGYDSQPQFGKKGRRIYYSKIRNSQADIYQYNIKKDSTQAYTQTAESEYSPTTIPREKGLSVIQVDNLGNQHVVIFNEEKKSRKYSDIKQVGYHNWTQHQGKNLWMFVLNENNGGDLYHQKNDNHPIKLEENIGRTLAINAEKNTVYYVDKNPYPWQIKSRNSVENTANIVIDLFAGTEDFAIDSKARLWTSQGENLYVSLNHKHWILVKQFTGPKMGGISRLSVSPKSDKIALVFAEPSPTEPLPEK